jgi:hypothetical protein
MVFEHVNNKPRAFMLIGGVVQIWVHLRSLCTAWSWYLHLSFEIGHNSKTMVYYVYGSEIGRYGSGMRLDHNPCRGWGCTHPRPIPTVSTGRGWGYWHVHTWYRNWSIDVEPGWDRDQFWTSNGWTKVWLRWDSPHSGPISDQHDGTGIPLPPSPTHSWSVYTDQL